MTLPFTTPSQRFLSALGALCLFGLAGCKGLSLPGKGEKKTDLVSAKVEKDGKDKPKEAEAVTAEIPASSVDLSFLLTMDYTEAKAMSAQSMELPHGVRVAADSIEVLKVDKENNPKRIRAKGKVYLESGEGQDSSKALCQEALITYDEIILRGKPILQRGGSIVEGLNDQTVAYMLGTRLRVIGLHRLTNQDTMVAMLPDLGPWAAGPNLLLPALAEDSVPSNIREEMQKAAEAEAVLQYNRNEALTQPDAPAAPWVKGAEGAAAKAPIKESVPPAKADKAHPSTAKPEQRKAA
jgi:hypothetical protein